MCSHCGRAPADTVFRKLAAALEVPVEPVAMEAPTMQTLVPYDASGRPSTDGRLMVLDLSPGAAVAVGQPDQGPKNCRVGRVDDVQDDGVALMTLRGAAGKLARQAALGPWWLVRIPLCRVRHVALADPFVLQHLAKRGHAPLLPLRNAEPVFVEPEEGLATVVMESRPREDGRHWDWELRVQPGPALPVARVLVGLHPSFVPAQVELTAPPFALRRSGWGTFDVQLRVVFVDGSEAVVAVPLRFEPEAVQTALPILVSQRRVL